MILSVTPTNQCNKDIRCEYCYLAKKAVDAPFDEFCRKMSELIEIHKPEVVTFAYNAGYPDTQFAQLVRAAHAQAKVSVTLQPECFESLSNLIDDIDYVALSVNAENFNETDILSVSGRLRQMKSELKIGVNFLMNRCPGLKEVLAFFKTNMHCFEQFHFLLPKEFLIPYRLQDATMLVKTIKMMFPDKVFVDECLKTVIAGAPCSRNGNLLSLNADASVTMCSFADTEDRETVVEKCPYLLAE